MRTIYSVSALICASLVACVSPPEDGGSDVDPGVSSEAQPEAATPNIARVPCNRGDLFILFNNTGTLCFAQAGDINVAIFAVTRYSSGNNQGWFVAKCRSGSMKGVLQLFEFPKFNTANLACGGLDVTHIHIDCIGTGCSA
jgi:hypothetical protein